MFIHSKHIYYAIYLLCVYIIIKNIDKNSDILKVYHKNKQKTYKKAVATVQIQRLMARRWQTHLANS